METGNYYYGARYYDPKWSSFISVDPLAEKTRDAYGYCYQNPINLVDPDGREADDVIVQGKLAQKYVDQLDASSSLEITRDKKTGKLSATGEAKTEADRELLNAISDTKITVKINVTSKNKVNGKFLFGDSFDGSEKKRNGKVIAQQTFNPNHTEIIEEFAGMDKGSIAMHAALEAYYGAKQNPGAKANDREAYLEAHGATNLIYPDGDFSIFVKQKEIQHEYRKSPFSRIESWLTKRGGETQLF
ncbi:RHS repeat-associated core domain-containing protein [Flavobacterium aurantiibacter]|uniref:RHS repeat-associated core domain-containing protein n=1 Tax=Flavobacterium aurantiibacter TaxID=2023067 RepID=A0A256A7D6_9FLAO|nr:RHS repeat-associated core domain-containing protein [Flavobacterium aurantiibacter]OYQ49648.1 hypothetical protein CHX27_01330 [Flavobacterium aurantiibacter]